MKIFHMLIIFSLLTLTGCWDREEMEQQGFVVALGIDKGNREDEIWITNQIANPQVGIPSTGGDKEPNSEIISFTAPGLVSAKDSANISVARKVNYSHLKVIVVSEELARQKQFRTLLDQLVRERDLRREAKVIISREKADDFIRRNSPKLETRPHKFYDLIASRWEETGLVAPSSTQAMFQNMETNQDAFVSIYASTKKVEPVNGEEDDYLPGQRPQKGGNTTQIVGGAVFMDGLMVGTLTGEEVRTSLLLKQRSNSAQMLTSYPDPLHPKYQVTARVQKQEIRRFHINTKKDPMEIHATLQIPIDILSIPSGEDYVQDKYKQRVLKEYIESNLDEKVNRLILKTQKELKANIFNWSDAARKCFQTMPDFLDYNFKEKYQKAKITIQIEVLVKGFGKQISPPKIKHE